MKNELVTVIINVYNGEDYIETCLDCVIRQTYKNLEILVVNDGSTDGTLEICKSYKDKRIRVVTTENLGLSLSRNVGIENAKGEYLYYIDVDDLMEPDTIEYLYGLCKKHKVKMATCGVREIFDYSLRPGPANDKAEVLSAKEMIRRNVLAKDYAISAWNKLIRKDVFNSIRFEDRILDDLAVTYKLIIESGKVAFGGQTKYYYLRNDDSITVKKKTNYNLCVDIYKSTVERFEGINKVYPNLVENKMGLLKGIVYLYTRRNKKLHKYLDGQGAKKIFKEVFSVSALKCDCRKMDKIIVVLFRISPKLYEFLLRIYLGLKGLKKKKCYVNKKLSSKPLPIIDKWMWVRKFGKVICSDRRLRKTAKGFFADEIVMVQERVVLPTDIVAICIEKNDLLKLKKFIEHHRKLGVDRFVVLDNDSDDGTAQYLLEQKDVVLLKTTVPYSTARREAWINRIISYYGYNRWYFVADSDELLAYNDCENKTLKDLAEFYKRKKIVRARALLLDMYAKEYFYRNGCDNDYFERCVYFDKDTYYKHKDKRFDSYMGGPRERVFGLSPCVTKYPFVFFRKNDVYIYSHFLYPYKDNFGDECRLVLMHYKFLPGEKKKIKQAVKDGNYYNGSIYYKHYLDAIEKDKMNFFCESTCEYKNDKSLEKINIYKKIDWK